MHAVDVAPLHLPCTAVARLAALSNSAAPHEACAVLVGRRGTVTRLVPLTNHADAPGRFVVDPLDLVAAERGCKADESMLGLFHSHPQGPAEPSDEDLVALRVWAPQIWLIRGRSGLLRAFRGRSEGGFEEVRVLSSGPP